MRSNVLQIGTKLDGTAYGRLIPKWVRFVRFKDLQNTVQEEEELDITNLSSEDICFVYRAFSWNCLCEMLKDIGIEDVNNSYVLLG